MTIWRRTSGGQVIQRLTGSPTDSVRAQSFAFAYAAAREATGEYRGIVAGRLAETPVTSTSLIVDGSGSAGPVAGGRTPEAAAPGPRPGPEPVRRVRRFHGEVSLGDPRRPIPELTKIVDEVIDRLAQQTDVRLHVTLQVEAEHSAADGFTDDTVRTISENAKTLRFKDFGWEKE